jgi:hypothetical protein
MQPSDFLTLLGLGLAIWSFIPKKERNFILLFFSKAELIIFTVTLLFILFLMSFDWLNENWFSWLSVFTVNKGISASIWAYIISLVLIVFPILKVSFSYFSASRLQNLITLYKTLIKENEIDLLAGYINKYHITDIQNYLIGLSHLPEKENIDLILRRRTASDEAYEKLVESKRIKFAARVYGQIIQNELFVKNAAPKYPELFATAFKGMETKSAAKRDLLKLYIESIFESKNQSFVEELKIVNDSRSSLKEMDKYYDLPILNGLLVNTEAAAENYVWYPVGEGAVKSLKYDKQQVEFLLKEYDSQLESELWNHKIWIATVYFNYMVRETIYRDGGWHMWLFYFRSSTDLLIEIIPLINNYNTKSEYPSFAHYIIYHQFDIMLEWIELAKEQETDNRVIDTVRCLGTCLHSVCQANEKKLSRDFKKIQLNRIVDTYLGYAHLPHNIASITAREWLKKLFLNPKGVDCGVPEITSEYLSLIKEVWEEYDKIPFTAHGNRRILDDFENDILQVLGIRA